MNLARGRELRPKRRKPHYGNVERPEAGGRDTTPRDGVVPTGGGAAAAATGEGFASAAEVDPAAWMGQLAGALRDVPLRRLRLPGSHNSGAYELSGRHIAPGRLPDWLWRCSHTSSWATAPIAGTIRRWGVTQALTVRGQLEAGVRYLDLRVFNHAGRFHAVHGMVGPHFDDILADVAAFVRERPTELVVLDLNHFYCFRGVADHEALVSLITAHLGPLLARRPPGNAPAAALTYGEAVRAGTPVVCLYGGCDHLGVAKLADGAGCWVRNKGTLHSPWPKARSLAELDAALPWLDAQADKAKGFFVLQGVVTPNTARILNGCLWLGPGSLESLVRKVTPHVVNRVASGELAARCIVLVDFVDAAISRDLLFAAYGSQAACNAPGGADDGGERPVEVGVEDVVSD